MIEALLEERLAIDFFAEPVSFGAIVNSGANDCCMSPIMLEKIFTPLGFKLEEAMVASHLVIEA